MLPMQDIHKENNQTGIGFDIQIPLDDRIGIQATKTKLPVAFSLFRNKERHKNVNNAVHL